MRLAARFPAFELTGVYHPSLPAGILSSFCFASPNHALLRWADRADLWIHEWLPRLRGRFRHAVLAIEKLASTPPVGADTISTAHSTFSRKASP